MNLFENLQVLEESVQSMSDLFEDIIEDIQQRFGCDIDNTSYDEYSYPKKFRAQMVLYDVSYDTCKTIKQMIEDELSNYENINVDIYTDDKYINDDVESAYVIRIRAHNNDIRL